MTRPAKNTAATITVDQAKAAAAMLQQDGLPDCFNRWIGVDTPSAIQEVIMTTNNTTTTPAQQGSDAVKADDAVKAARLGSHGQHAQAALDAKKAAQTAKGTSGEPKGTKVEPKKAPGTAHGPKPNRKAKGASSKGRAVTTKAKGKNAPKATGKAAKGSHSKIDLIESMLKRKGGCTSAQVCKATGWKAVSIPPIGRRLGLKLKKTEVDGVMHYSAA